MGVCSTLPDVVQAGRQQRDYPSRAVFNAVRYVVRSGVPWRMMPNDLPPWHVVYQFAAADGAGWTQAVSG